MKFFLANLISHRIKKVSGLQFLPKHGPAILVANHSGEQDGPLLYALIMKHTGQIPYSIVKWKILSGKFCRKYLHTIPLYDDRQKTIELTSKLLSQNKFIIIFPEGGVNLENNITKAKTGAIRIALQNKVPIIPIGLIRANRKPKNEFDHILDIFIGSLIININSPIYLNPWYNVNINKQTLAEINRLIMTQVAKLSNKRYIS